MAQEMCLFLKVYINNLVIMIKNFIAKILRTPKFKQRKVESKKKYKRKKKVSGYYFDYDGKQRILYDDNQ